MAASRKPLRRIALALAGVLLGATGATAQERTGCEQDLSDLERVSAELVLGSSTTREVTLLLHAAKAACADG